MKKTVILLFVLSSALNTFAQKIESDKTVNGERTIICSHENVRSMKDKVVFSVALCLNQSQNGGENYNISLKATSLSPITVPKGGKLLIKLMDDSIIELSTIMEYAGTVRDVHNINGYVYSDYTIFPAFLLTIEQIDQICKGVKKIRLETTTGAVDKDFKKDKIGQVIAVEYDLIKSALSQKKSFSDDF
ncbi:hypothetical protein ACJEEV_14390 [Bacteroides xylanisolvens]|jgi:hypothetical protein|uniref:hypothetical protein n=1 Tax=Bacteroides xylanisolvens TaxID=371601 RepID=UPI003979F1D1